MNIDFGSVPDSTLPEGVYTGRILTCEQQVSKNSGNQMLVLGWAVGDNDFQIRSWAVLEGKGLFMTKKLFNALGFDVESDVEFTPEDLVGSECGVVIKNEEYKDELQSKITSFVALEESPGMDGLETDIEFEEFSEDPAYNENPADYTDLPAPMEPEAEFASTAAKKLAVQLEIDIEDMIDAGYTGKLTIADVRDFNSSL